MRILISNPDTIGDVVLRQPMFSALAAAGHELMLVVQPALAPIMGLVAPGARIEICHLPAYDPRLGVGAPELEPLAAAAAAFEPEVYVVAPYQWTVVEERLAFALPKARCVAMNGRRYGDPHFGAPPLSRIEPAVVVEVARDLPELKKNERVTSAVLGTSVTLPDPVLTPGEAVEQLAGAALGRLGLAPGGYWAACIGDSRSTAVRNWRPQEWAELLGRWAKKHDEKFLFIGLRSESETVAWVREAMGDAGAATAEWCGDEGGDLETLVGLVALSRGYIGRDTGPMHVAAALGKPVAAVFGGGTWPRFVPAGARSVAVTIGVPCTGCEWRCHLADSYCIKRVPVDEVWKAVQEVRSGKVTGARARVLAPDAELLARIGREGAEAAQVRLVQASVARRELAEERKSMNQNGIAEGAVETLYGPEPKPGAFRESRREESVVQVSQLQARVAEQGRQRGEQLAAIESLREQLGEAKARTRDLEARLERRVADLLTATAEGATTKEKNSQLERTLAAAKRETDQSRQQCDAATDSMRRAQTEAQQARSELQQIRAQLQQAQAAGAKAESQLTEVKQRAAALSAERDNLKGELTGAQAARDEAARKLNGGEGQGARLAAAQKALGEAKADLHDLQAKSKRYETERVALAKLSRQQEGQIAVLQERLDNLMRSRARLWGQRLGLVRTMPWEVELRQEHASQNGSV